MIFSTAIAYCKSIIVKLLAIILLFMLIISNGIICTAETKPDSSRKNILILHSYDEGLKWTHDQNEAIFNLFRKQYSIYNLYIEYMDCKNFSDGKNLEQFEERMAYKYSSKKIDIIITTDDPALQFALEKRSELFSDAPIVFSGVNKKGVEELTSGQTSVTGAIEEIDPVGTLKAALMINPDIKEIYVLYDNTESGLTTGELTVNAIQEESPFIKVTPLNSKSMEEINQIVSNAADDSIVLCTSFTTDINGNIIGLEYYGRVLCQSSRVPVYHLFDLGIGNGAVGGSVVIGRLQGEQAAGIALRVLNGEDISQIPFVSKAATKYMFDYDVLQRFSINTDSLPVGSKVINKPYSYFEEHANVFLTAVTAFVMLLIFIIVLLFYLNRLRGMRKELIENNLQLTGLNEDLTVASNKLKKQYDELVSVQNDLSSSKLKVNRIIDKMINGFFIFEPVFNAKHKLVDIRFLLVTQSFFDNMDIPKTDITGKTWLEVFGRPNNNLGYYEYLIETGRSSRFESYDAQRGVYYLIEPFLIDENQYGVMFENITEYKKVLKEVKLLNTDLEKRVVDRTVKLQDAIEELESFSYTVSHDLKSPLRAVDGYVKIMLEDFGEKLDSDAVQMLNNISTISRESIDMINAILNYSRTSRAVMNKEQVSIKTKIEGLFNELKHAYPRHEAELIIETGLPEVFVDYVLFGQVIQNILSNSFKFSQGREKTVITAGCNITEDHYVIYIKDNGVGFDMKYSGKLFVLFQRLHTADEFEGSGIGLVTVKKIVEKHGGKVWIESKLGEGTTVFFTIPIKPN